MTATELLFGDDTKSASDCEIYDSLKMRVAVEVSGDPKYFLGARTTLPDGFTAADFAALTVWFLISEGHRAVAVQLNGHMEGVEMGMTMGVPMDFFNDKQLRASFLSIARRAWTFYCKEGLLDSPLLIEKARRVKAWSEASGKLNGNALELSCWRYHKVFVTGGGSRLPLLVDAIGMHPDEREPLVVTALEQPVDLARADGKKIATEELPFLTVAYGLSNTESFLPNPYVRDTGRMRTHWRHLGEESPVESA
jgi:hypothetical protein